MLQFLQDNMLISLLVSNVVQAVGWVFAFRKRKVENDSSEASALNSIRELNNSMAADLKERYMEQATRIDELENRERKSIEERGILYGKLEQISKQTAEDKILIRKLQAQINGYKTEVASWKTKFDNLQKQFVQLKKHNDEK